MTGRVPGGMSRPTSRSIWARRLSSWDESAPPVSSRRSHDLRSQPARRKVGPSASSWDILSEVEAFVMLNRLTIIAYAALIVVDTYRGNWWLVLAWVLWFVTCCHYEAKEALDVHTSPDHGHNSRKGDSVA